MICVISITDNEPTGWIVAVTLEEAARHAESALLPDLAKEIRALPDSSGRLAPGRYKLSYSRWLLVTAGDVGDFRWDVVAFGCRPAPAGSEEKE